MFGTTFITESMALSPIFEGIWPDVAAPPQPGENPDVHAAPGSAGCLERNHGFV